MLIAGGRSKGNPVDALASAVAERVTAAVLIGDAGTALGVTANALRLSRIRPR